MILALALLLTVAVIVFTLLVRPQDLPEPEPVSPVQHLDERKARIYENLRDLQFEYRVGKLSDEDYQRTKLGLQSELAATLAEIDRVLGKAPPKPPAASPAPQSAPVVAAASPIEIPREIEDPLRCPHCLVRFERPMKFCGQCGKPMTEVDA